MNKRILLIVSLFFLFFCKITLAEPQAEKLRILVDKVMQFEGGWVTEEWMVRETKEAGFNVFSPRQGFDRFDEVIQVADWARKYNILYVPWMRGSLNVPEGAIADGKKYVSAEGVEYPVFSPNSNELWDWMAQNIVEYAKISAENHSLMGVFLDYENYNKVRGIKNFNYYGFSYDDQIFNLFAKAKNIKIPTLKYTERETWLINHQLQDDFEQFQVDLWRKRCRALRRAVDQYSPSFQFIVYPGPLTFFIKKACGPEWATQKAPVIWADASTYGRSKKSKSQALGLDVNRQNILRMLGIAKKSAVPFKFLGGIDPIMRGTDPEFSGKNAVLIAEMTDGYWVFYEGPKYHGTHKKYFKWFAWANQAIQAGKFNVWREPRLTPDKFQLPKGN